MCEDGGRRCLSEARRVVTPVDFSAKISKRGKRKKSGFPTAAFDASASSAVPSGHLSLSLLLSVFLLSHAYGAPPRAWSGKAVGVFDGDTLTIHGNGEPEIIRLRGIDCPEEDQAGGIRAKEFTTKMVLGKTVEVFSFFTYDSFNVPEER